MNGGQLPTNQLHDISWGALDHASHAPQLMSYNYCVCVCVCVCVGGGVDDFFPFLLFFVFSFSLDCLHGLWLMHNVYGDREIPKLF